MNRDTAVVNRRRECGEEHPGGGNRRPAAGHVVEACGGQGRWPPREAGTGSCGDAASPGVGMSWLPGNPRPSGRGGCQERTPDYFHSTEPKHNWFFKSVDGHHWHIGDGNNRTCLARFHFERLGEEPIVHGVETVDNRVDWGLLAMYRLLRKTYFERHVWRVEAKATELSREENGDVTILRRAPTIVLRRGAEAITLRTAEEAQDAFLDITRTRRHSNPILRWLGRWMDTRPEDARA